MLDYTTFKHLHTRHPARRLLCSDHAPLIAQIFLHRAFILPNVRMMLAADIVEAPEDVLYGLREQLNDDLVRKVGYFN